jgi:dipeptidase E
MSIVALGGYGNTQRDLPLAICKHILKRSGGASARVLFMPTPGLESSAKIDVFYQMFRYQLDCQVEVMGQSSRKLDSQLIQDQIKTADVIFVGGGDTLRMMKMWRRNGIDALLRRAAFQGAVLAGVSAGATCWFAHGQSDSASHIKSRKGEFIRVRGIGLVPLLFFPHFQQAGRKDALQTTMRGVHQIGLACDDGAAVEIDHTTLQIVRLPFGGRVHRIFRHGSQIEIQDITHVRHPVTLTAFTDPSTTL